MEGKAGDRCYTLAHETFMVLDGAQSVAGVVEHANKLLHWPAAQKQAQRRLVGNNSNKPKI